MSREKEWIDRLKEEKELKQEEWEALFQYWMDHEDKELLSYVCEKGKRVKEETF